MEERSLLSSTPGPPKRKGWSASKPSSSPSSGIAEVALRVADDLSTNATVCERARSTVTLYPSWLTSERKGSDERNGR